MKKINDLKIIKKKYGENMMHLCRNLFPDILETPGILSSIMLNNFEVTRFLYEDIIRFNMQENFKNYVYSKAPKENREKIIVQKTPYELLSDAGYILYECKTEEEVQVFKKYYNPGREMLCTFNENRLKKNYIFFAVRKDVDNIKREDFDIPRREDRYGTSVLSIQFSRGNINYLSIKNRYNVEVEHPDNTFDNNLDNIVLGLTESFRREYNFNFEINPCNFILPGYEKNREGKYYKYNYLINDIYYGPNNIIIDKGIVVDKYLECEKYLIIDYFVIDLVNKTINLYDDSIKDSFIDGISNITKINIKRHKATKIIEIICDNKEKQVIVVDNTNKIIKYYNDNLVKIGNNFLRYNTDLRKLAVPNVEVIGDECLSSNISLSSLILNKVKYIGNKLLYNNKILDYFEALNLEYLGDYCFKNNINLSGLYLESIKKIGDFFLSDNKILNKFYAPYLEKIGNYFLCNNVGLKDIRLGKLKKVGNNYFKHNIKLNLLITKKILKEQISDFYNSSIISTLKVTNSLLERLEHKIKYMSIKEYNSSSKDVKHRR